MTIKKIIIAILFFIPAPLMCMDYDDEVIINDITKNILIKEEKKILNKTRSVINKNNINDAIEMSNQLKKKTNIVQVALLRIISHIYLVDFFIIHKQYEFAKINCNYSLHYLLSLAKHKLHPLLLQKIFQSIAHIYIFYSPYVAPLTEKDYRKHANAYAQKAFPIIMKINQNHPFIISLLKQRQLFDKEIQQKRNRIKLNSIIQQF